MALSYKSAILRAERRAGEITKAMKNNGELASKRGKAHLTSRDDTLKTHKDLGLSRVQVERWQQLAAVPHDSAFLQKRYCPRGAAGRGTILPPQLLRK